MKPGNPSAQTETAALLTCPHCGFTERLEMPREACLFFHPCAGCGEVLRPRPGDCCVFCSYADVPCPPVQTAGEDDACCRETSSKFKDRIA